MKNSGKTLLFLLAGGTVFAQNMVTNPAMDVKCSSGYGEITKTETWTNANGGTVDLFDRNNANKRRGRINGIPKNYMGTQTALSDQNYAGIIAFYDDGPNHPQEIHTYEKLGLKQGYKQFSEYLQAELAQPLVAGKIYLISFKVSLAEKSGRAVSNLGAVLSNGKIEQESNSFLEQKPQFISHRVISDTEGWVTLSGAYIAEGGEKFLTIGCFPDEYFRAEKVVSPMENDSRKAYYYISNVSVGPYNARPDLEPIVFGVDYVELMDLQFAHESSVIETQFHDELNQVASWMTTHPELTFFIAGYTDKTGNSSINDPLSLARAKAVKKYLVAKGVRDGNLITEGFGSSNPIENQIRSRRNRRVEIYLYSINRASP